MEETRLEKFVRVGRFVDPEKLAAVQIYGIDKAEEMWKNGTPSLEESNKLRKFSALKAFYGML